MPDYSQCQEILPVFSFEDWFDNNALLIEALSS